MKKNLFRVLAILSMLAMMLGGAVPTMAATDADITVTATPAFISISNAPGTWTVGGLTGSGYIAPDTLYYANPGGDTVAPSATVVDGECNFTITNTSTIAIDLTVNFPDHTGGDASTNSDTGANGTTSFGAYSYFSGDSFAAKVIAKSAASDVAYASLGATTDIKWGIQYESQSNAWASGTAMSSTVNIAAVAS